MDGYGLGRKGEAQIDCPFCQKGKVKGFHKEGYLQAKTSRISVGAKTKYYRKPDTVEVLEDCPNCGKKKKEIQKALDGKIEVSKISHEERLKRFKEAGLPLVIEDRL